MICGIYAKYHYKSCYYLYKIKEINATCTKKQTLLRQQERRLNVKSEMETLCPPGTFREAVPIGEERGETDVFAGYSLLKN